MIAQLAPVCSIGGSLISATNLSNVTFKGITFEVDNYVPPPSGFNNDTNSENSLPEAIDCESCQHVSLDEITVRRTSASAILIASASSSSGPPASNDVIQNSAFYDLGDSGIRIGHDPVGSDKAASVVQSVLVQNNIVQGYSRVFPDGEGIAQANGRDITYLHNDVNDGYQAGISICLYGCPAHNVNGSNIVSQYNHIWNIKQGLTSDGGTLYYDIGSASGSGTGNKILNNLVHDSTDSSILDTGVKGSGYGGHGIYVDNHSAGVDVENNVVYRIGAATAWRSDGVAAGQPPNLFKNNIFAYGRQAMFIENSPWGEGCGTSVRDDIKNNIFYFDREASQNFYVVHGCAFSCGLDYNKFLNFQGNLYWRTDGKFSSYDKAFHVMTKAVNPKSCITPPRPGRMDFLTFAQWQDGKPPNGIPDAMNEDKAGTATVDPGFGHTGKPSDFLLTRNPIAGFDYTKTNDTIRNAGRNHPVIMPPAVPATFPTYNYTSTDNKGAANRVEQMAVFTVALAFSLGSLAARAGDVRADVFVAANGNDSWSGKLAAPNAAKTDGPFASLARAQAAVRELLKAAPRKPVTVLLRRGTYYLPLSPTSPGALLFGSGDSGTAAAPVGWQNYPGETPVVSGGEPIGKGGLALTWTHVSGSLWQVPLPASTQPFEYLFYNGERRLRSRLESSSGVGYYMKGDSCYSTVTNQMVATSLCNLGSYLRVAAEIPPTGENAGCPKVTREDGSASKCLDRFEYNPGDPIAKWANLNPSGSLCGGSPNKYPAGDVELTLFDSWTVDVMRVSCIDTEKHVIYFTGATKGIGHSYPYHGPVKGHRYIVENAKDAFDAAQSAGQTGLWFLDRSTISLGRSITSPIRARTPIGITWLSLKFSR